MPGGERPVSVDTRRRVLARQWKAWLITIVLASAWLTAADSIALGAVRDFRDNPLNATRGSVQAMTAEVAGGPFKGTSSFRKLSFVSSWYTPFSSKKAPGGLP